MNGSAVAKDVPVLLEHLSKMCERLGEVRDHVDSLHQHLTTSASLSKSDIDLLGSKNQLLLSYLVDLVFLMSMKCERSNGAAPYQQLSSLDRVLEIRTTLEKMRPLEQKFNYQLDKLLRTASYTAGGDHPLQFKPAPENLISKEKVVEAEACGEEESGGEMETSGGVYVPPRVVAVPYREKQGHSHSFPKSQLGKSRLMRELRDEVSDCPAEIQTGGKRFRENSSGSRDKQKESYEEENLVRLSKKHSYGWSTHITEQEDVMDFSLFHGEGNINSTTKKRKKSRVKSKTKYTRTK